MHVRELRTQANARTFFDSPYVVIDTETTGLDPWMDKLVVCGLANANGETAYIMPENIDLLKDLPKSVSPVGHYFKFDICVLLNNGVNLLDFSWYDTLHMHHLLNEEASHKLGDIVISEFGETYKDLFWGEEKDITKKPLSEVIEYCAKDCLYTQRLYKLFMERLKENNQLNLHQETAFLARELIHTEINGIFIDKDYLIELGIKTQEKTENIRQEMKALVKNEIDLIELELWSEKILTKKSPKGRQSVERPEFNFDSQKHLMRLLYQNLGLPEQFNQKTKQISVDEKSLEAIKKRHPLISKIIDYRGLQKINGTYIQGTIEREYSGRIYPHFNVSGTRTGRISSSDPNMQQWPRDGGVRGVIVPLPRHKIITCDYSSLELVISAHYTRDENLLKIVLEGASQHDITAEALGINRHAAKTLNFAMMYGCSEFKIRQLLSVTAKKAKFIYDKYWDTYKGVKNKMDECKSMVDAGIPITTLFGRKRHFEKKERPPWDEAYRQAFNFLIQGTGADLCNRAYYNVSREMRNNKYGRALFPIHDEILIEAKDEHIEEAKIMLQKNMTYLAHSCGLSVPLGVSCSEALTRWEK